MPRKKTTLSDAEYAKRVRETAREIETRTTGKFRGPPMSLRNMRQNHVRMVTATCEACWHKADLNVDQLPEETYLPDVANRLVCSKCGSKRINTRPAWHAIERPSKGT